MSKAYDRVESGFLEAVIGRMGFAPSFIKLIIMCVTTAHYAVLVNGVPMRRIAPTKGIRQGNPLSSYLFLMYAETLSSLLSRADREGVLTCVPTSKRGPRINHLFFADGSLLFNKVGLGH
jgi:hypothetical protein